MKRDEVWRGSFGDEYLRRGAGFPFMFSLALRDALEDEEIFSAIELGAGTGIALEALASIYSNLHVEAVEINHTMAKHLEGIANVVYETSLFDFEVQRTYDLVIANGLLSCLEPESVEQAYGKLVESVGRLLWVFDYYGPEQVATPHEELGSIVACDWGKRTLEVCPTLELIRNSPMRIAGIPSWWLFRRKQD